MSLLITQHAKQVQGDILAKIQTQIRIHTYIHSHSRHSFVYIRETRHAKLEYPKFDSTYAIWPDVLNSISRRAMPLPLRTYVSGMGVGVALVYSSFPTPQMAMEKFARCNICSPRLVARFALMYNSLKPFPIGFFSGTKLSRNSYRLT